MSTLTGVPKPAVVRVEPLQVISHLFDAGRSGATRSRSRTRSRADDIIAYVAVMAWVTADDGVLVLLRIGG